jgi:hypothetical protein
MAQINGISGMTPGEIAFELNRGGRFVVYRYCFSAVVVTMTQNTGVYLVRADKSRIMKGMPWTLLTLCAGWWGFRGDQSERFSRYGSICRVAPTSQQKSLPHSKYPVCGGMLSAHPDSYGQNQAKSDRREVLPFCSRPGFCPTRATCDSPFSGLRRPGCTSPWRFGRTVGQQVNTPWSRGRVRLKGISRTTPIGWLQHASGARRPRVTAGLRAPHPSCLRRHSALSRSSSRQKAAMSWNAQRLCSRAGSADLLMPVRTENSPTLNISVHRFNCSRIGSPTPHQHAGH